MAVVRKDPDADATTDVDAAMTMAAAADFPTGEMAPADATFCGSLFFFAHAAETVSDATTDHHYPSAPLRRLRKRMRMLM